MSTTGTSEPENLSPLFRLPRELRDLIYEHVFADLISNPLYIRRFCADPEWKVCYNPLARVPGLLLTSKTIYSESKSCLYSSCNPPRIVIEDKRSPHLKSAKSPEEFMKQRGFAVRDLETIVPILTTVRELKLEIKNLDRTPCLLLVRWIRAVLNAREMQLHKASIGLGAGVGGHLYPHIRDALEEVCKETARINKRNYPLDEIWLLKRKSQDTLPGPWFGIAWEGRNTVQVEVPKSLPCSVAWQDLIRCKSPVGTWAPEDLVIVQPSSYLGAGAGSD
jgi:hypothetical protein